MNGVENVPQCKCCRLRQPWHSLNTPPVTWGSVLKEDSIHPKYVGKNQGGKLSYFAKLDGTRQSIFGIFCWISYVIKTICCELTDGKELWEVFLAEPRSTVVVTHGVCSRDCAARITLKPGKGRNND